MTATRRSSQAIRLKIELLDTKPLVWRRIDVLANSKLENLGFAIFDVVGLGLPLMMLYGTYFFEIGDEVYGDAESDCAARGWRDSSKINVARVARKARSFQLSSDGDSGWRFRVLVEDEFEADLEESYPVCIAGENAAPPCDCEGPRSFEEFKDSIPLVELRKAKSRREAMTRSMNQGERNFDPRFFDARAVNYGRLQRRRVPRRSSLKS